MKNYCPLTTIGGEAIFRFSFLFFKVDETEIKKKKSLYAFKNGSCAQNPPKTPKVPFCPRRPQERVWSEVPRPAGAPRGLLDYQERLPSPLWVFIMVQCCKITGFPQCFLLFVRPCHGNLEPVQRRRLRAFLQSSALRNP